jgi:multidrug efflux pump subunit AcrA (membrane-fusion protein)
VKPQWVPFERTIEQPGSIEPFERAPLYARIAGHVKKVHVDIGARVREGDVLAELWVPEMEKEVEQKRAQVQQFEKAAETAEVHIATALALVRETEAGLARAEANRERWQTQSDNLTKLFERQILDEQTKIETLSQLKVAQAAVREAAARAESTRALYRESQAARDKAKADVEVARAECGRAEAMLQYATIRAPFDGIVDQRHVDPGHLLQPTASNQGVPLFVVVRTDRVRIFVDVPEADAALIHEGDSAHVRVPALNDQEFEGQVHGCSWSLVAGERTLLTEIHFHKPEEKPRPGMYVYVRIDTRPAPVLTLPAAALQTRDGQTSGYCLENGKAVRTLVRTGARRGDQVEVLKKQGKPARPGEKAPWQDFDGGEEILVGKPGSLVDGQAVRVTN